MLAILEEADLEAFAATYRGTLAVTTLEDSLLLFYAAEWQSPLAWVFGAQGQGVRRALLDRAGLKIRIPMPGAVESLMWVPQRRSACSRPCAADWDDRLAQLQNVTAPCSGPLCCAVATVDQAPQLEFLQDGGRDFLNRLAR